MDRNYSEKTFRVYQAASQGIETNVEELTYEELGNGVMLIKEKKSYLGEDDIIHDRSRVRFPLLSCGCIGEGTTNMGSKCYFCHEIPCKNHSYRCARCEKSVCIRCAKRKGDKHFCNKCWWTLTIFRRLRGQYEI